MVKLSLQICFINRLFLNYIKPFSQILSYMHENEVHSHANSTHFHMNGFAPDLALIEAFVDLEMGYCLLYMHFPHPR